MDKNYSNNEIKLLLTDLRQQD